jgi:NAD(P)-dependent dehydrogenase (short-subunit alcohol dehydrogenase family)
MTFQERVALVTGASQGIGRACALELARAGAKVALAARNQNKLKIVLAEIADAGGQAEAFHVDVSDEDSIKGGMKAAIAQFGKIDILVNNAGVTRDQLVMRMKRPDWDEVIGTNLTGAHLCIQAVIGSMLKQRWGRIINITSVFGQMGQAGQANYAASKAGLIGLTIGPARADLPDHGRRAACLAHPASSTPNPYPDFTENRTGAARLGPMHGLTPASPPYVGNSHYCFANATAMLLASIGEHVSPSLIEALSGVGLGASWSDELGLIFFDASPPDVGISRALDLLGFSLVGLIPYSSMETMG